MSRDRTGLVVFGCLGLGLILLLGSATAAYLYLRGAPSVRASADPAPAACAAPGGPATSNASPLREVPGSAAPPDRTPSPARPLPSPTQAPGPTSGETGAADAGRGASEPPLDPDTQSFHIDDWTQVDPQELFAPARTLARRVEPTCDLHPQLPLMARGAVVRGTIDLTNPEHSVTLRYGYYYLDSSKSPGRDVVEGLVEVKLELRHAAVRVARGSSAQRWKGYRAMREPTCSVRSAWKSVVASGVPEHAIASLHLWDSHQYTPRRELEWGFRIDGHEEWNRTIDALSCRRIR